MIRIQQKTSEIILVASKTKFFLIQQKFNPTFFPFAYEKYGITNSSSENSRQNLREKYKNNIRKIYYDKQENDYIPNESMEIIRMKEQISKERVNKAVDPRNQNLRIKGIQRPLRIINDAYYSGENQDNQSSDNYLDQDNESEYLGKSRRLRTNKKVEVN